MAHIEEYMRETAKIADQIDYGQIEKLVQELVSLRARKGRLFFIGLGGSAANCSHAVNDFRKLCGIEAYSACDNVSELTARANDEGWNTIFRNDFWTSNDAIFVLSVGGGTFSVSVPIFLSIQEAQIDGVKILGIVGRDGGITYKLGDCVVVVPTVSKERVTPHTEGWQSVILHCIVSHPDLQRNKTKW